MPTKLASIIIPTYNRADIIAETVSSVLNQTITDIEVIIVDDGSIDLTETVVQNFTDSRVCLIKNTWTGLPAVARNTGIRIADGKYIAFVDSDDVWYPEKLERQLTALDAEPHVGMCFCGFDLMDHVSGKLTPAVIPELPPDRVSRAQLVFNGNFIGSLTPVVRREVFELVGLFDEAQALRFCEDWEMWLRILARYDSIYIPERLAAYRVHAANSSADAEIFTKALRHIEAVARAVAFAPETYGPVAKAQTIRHGLSPIKQLLVNGEPKKARTLAKRCLTAAQNIPSIRVLALLSRLPTSLLRLGLTAKRRLHPTHPGNTT